MKNRLNWLTEIESQLRKSAVISLDYQKMLCHLMRNKLLTMDAESEKDRFKGIEMRAK